MNQDILFADLQTWDAERRAVMFPAQQAGAFLACWVSIEWLQKHAAEPLTSELLILAAFNAHRFDLEDIAEGIIEDEAFNELGEIIID